MTEFKARLLIFKSLKSSVGIKTWLKRLDYPFRSNDILKPFCQWMDGWMERKTDITLINPLNTKLNPICHLLALLGTHHILHVSSMRVSNKH